MKKYLTWLIRVFICLCISSCQDTTHMNKQETEIENESSVSYNAFLYSDGSMSGVISSDSFGFSVSKYTDNADRRLEERVFEPLYLNLSKHEYESYSKWICSHEVEYVYSDLYNIEYVYKNINNYRKQMDKQHKLHKDLITTIDNIPTKELIYQKLMNNSNEYLKTHREYNPLNHSYLDTIAEILSRMIKNNYSNLNQNDIQRIYCMLNDVKAVSIDSTDFTVNDLKQIYNARVTDDAVIILDPEMMKQLRGNHIEERTIAHEVVHLLQRMCPDHKIEGLTQIGNSLYVEEFDNTGEVNSLHFQWLYEATAEQMSMKAYKANVPLVYTNMVGYLSTLNLITLLSDKYDENSIAVSQLSNNPNKMYDLFDIQTEQEKIEIIRMLYSICYIQSEREDFTSAYEAKYGNIDGLQTTIKKEMKESIVQTMTKYFYNNLAKCIVNNQVTLQDVFYLINVFESSLNRHIIYDDHERYAYNDEAIVFYLESQNRFFKMLAKENNYTFEDITQQFDEYALVKRNGNEFQRNYQFFWLSDNEKEYIEWLLTTNINHLTINIRTEYKNI